MVMTELRLTIKGFTLIELMITLTVAAILLGLAAPSFIGIIKDSRLTTQINSLAASLNLARSEAIKRSLTVTVCKSNDQTACGGNWHDGWIVYEDIDGNGAVDPGDTIIRINSALSNGNTLVFPGRSRVTYQADGFAIGYNSTFKLCDDRGYTKAKGLVVSNSGRVRTADSSDLTSCT
jgi:type IV fimbrial biogenesis protein FimT